MGERLSHRHPLRQRLYEGAECLGPPVRRAACHLPDCGECAQSPQVWLWSHQAAEQSMEQSGGDGAGGEGRGQAVTVGCGGSGGARARGGVCPPPPPALATLVPTCWAVAWPVLVMHPVLLAACPEGERWQGPEVPPGCEQSCRDILDETPANCTPSPSPGCTCEPGHYRNSSGHCVPSTLCECLHQGQLYQVSRALHRGVPRGAWRCPRLTD